MEAHIPPGFSSLNAALHLIQYVRSAMAIDRSDSQRDTETERERERERMGRGVTAVQCIVFRARWRVERQCVEGEGRETASYSRTSSTGSSVPSHEATHNTYTDRQTHTYTQTQKHTRRQTGNDSETMAVSTEQLASARQQRQRRY